MKLNGHTPGSGSLEN